ncbi:hypothetical protein [Pinibacter aurantiacus]|uniref:Lipoprotein n=1 Tax=Pinibacter aurantiacus TaxID=2851599 RepID=A0A9E2W1P6_9BACT|nr:hypothetical protein [Pinibacter aurantiacus]MBV4356340.1 hypothetical protein [Pinibacter aurantiacus]
MFSKPKGKASPLLALAFCFFAADCYSQVITPKDSRTGYYMSIDDSYFGYLFYPGNFCVSVTLGHFGNSKVYNRYTLQHDTVLITPLPAKFQTLDYSAWKRDTLIFKNDSCLFNIREKWEYCLLYDTIARKSAFLR